MAESNNSAMPVVAGRELEAGRELDALIWQKVFGGNVEWSETPTRRTVTIWKDAERLHEWGTFFWAKGGPMTGGSGYLGQELSCFSTDEGDAFKVVAWMKENAPTRYKNLSLVAYCYNRTYATFDAQSLTEYDAETWVEANEGEYSTPVAICLAALKALDSLPHDQRPF